MANPIRGVTAAVTVHAPEITATVIPGDTNPSGDVKAEPAKYGSVILRGISVSLTAEIGRAFVADCARHIEGLVADSDIKNKWGLNDEDWGGLATNAPLLQVVRTERENRITNGDAAREAAQRYFANAPTVLGDILSNEQVSPRHRIEAARELRQVAGEGPSVAPGAGEKFVIKIDLGEDKKLVFEKEIAPRLPSNDGELS